MSVCLSVLSVNCAVLCAVGFSIKSPGSEADTFVKTAAHYLSSYVCLACLYKYCTEQTPDFPIAHSTYKSYSFVEYKGVIMNHFKVTDSYLFTPSHQKREPMNMESSQI